MPDRGRGAASRSQDWSARSQGAVRRRISMPCSSGAGAGRRHLPHYFLRGAAALLAALVLAAAQGTEPGWALASMPAGATDAPAPAHTANHGAAQSQAPTATADVTGRRDPAGTAGAAEDTARRSAAGGETAGSGQARLSRAEVPAAGRQEIILSVERF